MNTTFSRYFPASHPRKGEPTFFVEQMIEWYYDTATMTDDVRGMIKSLNTPKFTETAIELFVDSLNSDVTGYKGHTIRYGNRFNVGDKFKPCVWTGLPYRSKVLQFLPELEVKKQWKFKIDDNGDIFLNNKLYVYSSSPLDMGVLHFAHNDGLSVSDFLAWFNEPFEGQIICWNKNINY